MKCRLNGDLTDGTAFHNKKSTVTVDYLLRYAPQLASLACLQLQILVNQSVLKLVFTLWIYTAFESIGGSDVSVCSAFFHFGMYVKSLWCLLASSKCFFTHVTIPGWVFPKMCV